MFVYLQKGILNNILTMISNKIIAKEFLMELVYLWVDKYKNIEKQGFNFSSRFRCEYDEKTNELNIIDKDKTGEFYPKNFFGDNINITAIVGENGSGKSSIIKLILMLIFYKKYNDTSAYPNEITMLKQELENKALFLIINTRDGYKKICLNTDINNSSVTELDNANIDFYSIYFSYMLDTLQNIKDHWLWNLYHKSDSYKTPILLTPNKFHKDFLQNSINLDDIEYVNIKHSIKFYKKNIKTKINDFFNPNTIKLYSDNPSSFNDVEFDFFGKVAGKFLDLNNRAKKDKITEYYENLKKKLNAIKYLETQKEYKKINLLYIAFKILSSAKSSFQNEIYDSVEKWFNEKLYEDDFLEEGVTLIESSIDKIFIDDIVKYNNEKINDCIEFHKNILLMKNDILNKLLNREKLELSDYCEIIFVILVPWLDLELLENEKSINSLSGGQKLFFTFMVNMMYEVSNLVKDEPIYKTINLFLDEVESGYHPNWQKEFIKNIMKALENTDLKDRKINLFFSTHSPFILSDLPKENIIFLEKGKQVHPFEDGKQTFGANIHTLLSHGFFMKDGLMGEFAKDKIDTAITYLNQKILTQDELDYCENIISIIGEPIIKRELQRKLDSKRLSKIDKIDEIEEQMKLLAHRLEMIRKNQK